MIHKADIKNKTGSGESISSVLKIWRMGEPGWCS